MWGIYKILQWETSLKVLPRGFLLYAKRKRGEKKRGEVGKYHFNLTFLRMRVNNTYPMESYFFPPRNHIGLYTPCRVLHSQRERETDRQSLPPDRHPSILPVQQKKGGSRKELVLLSAPDRSLCTCSLHTAKYLPHSHSRTSSFASGPIE